jgi:hypothetical protein
VSPFRLSFFHTRHFFAQPVWRFKRFKVGSISGETEVYFSLLAIDERWHNRVLERLGYSAI